MLKSIIKSFKNLFEKKGQVPHNCKRLVVKNNCKQLVVKNNCKQFIANNKCKRLIDREIRREKLMNTQMKHRFTNRNFLLNKSLVTL